MELTRLPFLTNKRDRESPVIGDERQQAVDLLHGKHYNDTLRGRVFHQASTPLGLALPVYTATAIAGGMPIWNPKGSGVNVELIHADFGYGSGTATYGSIGLMYINTNQSSLATGAPITAFAATTPTNGLLGYGLSSQVQSSNAGTCTITAGTAANWIRTLASFNLEAQTGTAHGIIQVHHDFDGTIIVPPGGLVFFAASQATTALFAASVSWKEIPI